MAFLIVQIFGDIFKDDNGGNADCQSAVSIVFGDNTSGRGGACGGPFSGRWQPASVKALDGGFFVVENFDDFRDPAIVEDKTDFQGEVGDFQLGAFVLGRDVAGDKIADAVAVDEIDSFEIEDELGFPEFELFFHQFLHRDRVDRRFRQPELALHPQNKDIALFFYNEIHGPPPSIRRIMVAPCPQYIAGER